MMKIRPIQLVVLLYTFILTVSGAHETQVVAVDGHLRLAREQEAAAGMHATTGEHANAASCYTKAAMYYDELASIQNGKKDMLGAAKHFERAAAMYKAAGKHASLHLKHVLATLLVASENEIACFVGLLGEYAEMGKRAEQRATHCAAACQYHQLANELAAGRLLQSLSMKLIAAKRYVANTEFARAFDCSISAAEAYSSAVERYRAACDADEERSTAETTEEEHGMHGTPSARVGHGGDADIAVACAAERRAGIGRSDTACAMNVARAERYEASVTAPEVQDNSILAASHGDRAADAYEAAGQPGKARLLWRAVAEQYEIAAIEREEHSDAAGAMCYYEEAETVYKKMGNHEKAQDMRDAKALLEDVC